MVGWASPTSVVRPRMVGDAHPTKYLANRATQDSELTPSLFVNPIFKTIGAKILARGSVPTKKSFHLLDPPFERC